MERSPAVAIPARPSLPAGSWSALGMPGSHQGHQGPGLAQLKPPALEKPALTVLWSFLTQNCCSNGG